MMYAMGLGVPATTAAPEWYLRSAMKGHPGAQSGVGWYYEVGRGLPAPDLVRAYGWYVLSAIGGDVDAEVSQEEVIKKMTPDRTRRPDLIHDYKAFIPTAERLSPGKNVPVWGAPRPRLHRVVGIEQPRQGGVVLGPVGLVGEQAVKLGCGGRHRDRRPHRPGGS